MRQQVLFTGLGLLIAVFHAVHAAAYDARILPLRSQEDPWVEREAHFQSRDRENSAHAKWRGRRVDALQSCATWMEQNSESIKHKSLLNLTLPGSHDSAAYQLNGHIMPGELPWALRQVLLIAERLGMSSEQYIIKWSESQVLTLSEQLQNGIRYLDLRAGRSLLVPPHCHNLLAHVTDCRHVDNAKTECDLTSITGHNGSDWVACHTAEGPKMSNVFNAIDEFLNQHQHEVLVVELTHTYNGQDQLSDLASLIKNSVGHHIAPCCSFERTMEDFWKDGRRLVFVSSVPCEEEECLWWPPKMIHNSYADSDELEVMWFYNRGILQDYRLNETQLAKMSWTLTPHISTLLHGLIAFPHTLAELANEANPLLPDFVDAALAEGRTEFPQLLIADDVQGAYLVLMALRINRLQPCKYLPLSDSGSIEQMDPQ